MDWVNSSRENNFDFDGILAGLYSNPSHFIYELLQNAEDEYAKKIRIELFEDRLDFYHDGKNFDLRDIDGVTGIGISKKKDDLTLIGKFGVGFKSVFAVTQTPYIFSGKYSIKIEDFVVPVPYSGNTPQEKGTLIRIPFNHKYRSKEEIFELIKNMLEKLDLKTLLFLNNIEEIIWQTPSSHGSYLKETTNIQTNVRKITLLSSEDVIEEYLLIKKPIEIDNKGLQVEVAYKLGKDKDGKEIIISEPNTRLVVFFPTERVTFLDFFIQGPYKTTPSREGIPLDDVQNRVILEETGNLVADSLSIIKELGYLDTNFLNILPINPDTANQEQIYSVIYKKVKGKLSTEELLPTSNGKFVKASDALLARGKTLTEFLDNNDIQRLFSKKYWLDTNITSDKTRELRNYLINELNIVEVDFESFARKITAEFLKTKSDNWMINFYKKLLDQRALWNNESSPKSILRTKPIIRLENGEHVAPFNDKGKIQVYLPSEIKSEYKTVKQTLTENEESLKFLKELGLTKPNLFAEIREFILPKYQGKCPIKDERYFNDFEKLLKGYETIQSNKKGEFVEELSGVSFIYTIKNDSSNETCLLKPSEAYFCTEDLKNYFSGYQPVYFVSDELYEKFGEERVKKFLKDLGVEDKPRRIGINADLTSEEKEVLRKSASYTQEICQRDYDYEGLENFLDDMTPGKSYLLWKLLLESIKGLDERDARSFFEGEYKWFYYSEHSANFDTKFIRILKQQAWLVDKNNNLKKPSEIAFSCLSDSYIKEGLNIEVLKEVLGFKPEIIEQLPERDRRILEITKNIDPDDLEKIISEQYKKPLEQKEEKWVPKYEPDGTSVDVEELEPNKIITPDLSNQVEISKTISEKNLTNEPKKLDKETKKALIDKKAIGAWGEKEVYKVLKERYIQQGEIIETKSGFEVIDSEGRKIEVIWLNKNTDTGKGCDFIIRQDSSDIKYIEVKTKTEENPELIEVTGTQWEWARKLYENGEGDRYYFYIVLNAGGKNSKIYILKNPVELWKEGKLYAHPVNFKL